MFEGRRGHALDQMAEEIDAYLPHVSLIGEIPITEADFEVLNRTVARAWPPSGDLMSFRHQWDSAYVATMVFCARYAQEEDDAFWNAFERTIMGSSHYDHFQQFAREQFCVASERLSRRYSHLRFPTEPQICVTAVYLHALVPKRHVHHLAHWIETLRREELRGRVGWDAVAAIGESELAGILAGDPLPTLHSRYVKRFLRSAPLVAARLVRSLCDFADQCWNRQDLDEEEVEGFLGGRAIELDLWQALGESVRASHHNGSPSQTAVWREPYWTWDINDRELRLRFPHQHPTTEAGVPREYVSSGGKMVVDAWADGGRWDVAPAEISDLEPGDSVRLRSMDGRALKSWVVPPLPSGPVLFCKPGRGGQVGEFVDPSISFTSGSWLILHRPELRLAHGEPPTPLRPAEETVPPYELRSYSAGLFHVSPPLTVISPTGSRTTYGAVVEEQHGCELLGEEAPAEHPAGFPVFLGKAPDLLARGLSPVEIQGLHVSVRGHLGQRRSFRLISVKALITADEASVVGPDLRLRLASLLPSPGRYEVALRAGLRTARFAPAEFVVIPPVQLTPPDVDRLHCAAAPPEAMIRGDGVLRVTVGGVPTEPVAPDKWLVVWNDCPRECSVELYFELLTVSLFWRVWCLRAGLTSSDEAIGPYTNSRELTEVEFVELVYGSSLAIEGRPGGECELFVGGQLLGRLHFDARGRHALRLEALRDAVAEAQQDRIEVVIRSEGASSIPFVVVRKPHETSPGVFVEGFRAISEDDSIRIFGEAHGPEPSKCWGMLSDLLRPWREPLELQLPPLSLWETGVAVNWPASALSGLCRLEISYDDDGSATMLTDSASVPLVVRSLPYANSEDLNQLAAAAGWNDGRQLARVASRIRLRATQAENDEWTPQLFARMLLQATDVGVRSRDHRQQLTSLLSRYRAPSKWAELWAELLRLMWPLGKLNRTRLLVVGQLGCNPARLNSVTLLQGIGSPGVTRAAAKLWAPFETFPGARLMPPAGLTHRGQALVLSASRLGSDGWYGGRSTLSGPQGPIEVGVRWLPIAGAGQAKAWLTRGSGENAKPCYMCTQCRSLLSEPRDPDHPWPAHNVRAITEDLPIVFEISPALPGTAPWEACHDSALYHLLIQSSLGMSSMKVRLTQPESSGGLGVRSLLSRDGHAAATKEWWYAADRDAGARVALNELVGSDREWLSKAIGAFWQRVRAGRASGFAPGEGERLNRAAEEFARWRVLGAPLSEVELVVWMLAVLNRAAARDNDLFDGIANATPGIRPRPDMMMLDLATARAFKGCPLLLARDLCWVEALLAWPC